MPAVAPAALGAAATGLTREDIGRTWRKYGLKPHQIKRFKLSRDPRLVEKIHDVVGLYLDPPTHAVVFSFDEKSQMQALDRTQPGLPLKKGRVRSNSAASPSPASPSSSMPSPAISSIAMKPLDRISGPRAPKPSSRRSNVG